jgi:hypothetical protein
MEIKSEKIKTWFWIIFIAVPLFTGFMEYKPSDNEYDERKHQVIDTRDVECGPEGLVSCEQAVVWKDLKSGNIFHLSDFKNYRRYEAFRIAILSFLYGIIACIFHVWFEVRYGIKNLDLICFGDVVREKLYKKQIFNEALKHALFVNGFIAVMWFIVI